MRHVILAATVCLCGCGRSEGPAKAVKATDTDMSAVAKIFDGIPAEIRPRDEGDSLRIPLLNKWLAKNAAGKSLSVEMNFEVSETMVGMEFMPASRGAWGGRARIHFWPETSTRVPPNFEAKGWQIDVRPEGPSNPLPPTFSTSIGPKDALRLDGLARAGRKVKVTGTVSRVAIDETHWNGAKADIRLVDVTYVFPK